MIINKKIEKNKWYLTKNWGIVNQAGTLKEKREG